MTDAELKTLLDAHDALVRGADAAARAMFGRFRRRIAFHCRVAAVISGIVSIEEEANPVHGEIGQFLPTVGLMRLRQLATRHPDYGAEPGLSDSSCDSSIQ